MKPSVNDGRQLGCARPRLLSFGPGAPLVLSGGRNLLQVQKNGAGAFSHEPRLWLNEKGDGVDFTAFSISYVHNLLETNATRHFTSLVNSTETQSTSYTSLMWAGERTGVLSYDAGRGLPWGSLAFTMRFTLAS